MAQYPSLKDDRVLYNRSDIYADQDIKITLLDGSILEIWGSAYYNGALLGSGGGSVPIATQAEAEAGTNNTAVMTPLRTAQAIDVQAVDKTLVDAKGDLLVATANDVVARLPVGTDGQYLQADSAQATGTKWAAATAVVADGDKGDIVVSGSGTSWMLDSTVVTAAAKTVLDDTTVSAMLTTLGGTTQGYVDTQVATKQPLDTDLTTIAGLTATTDNIIQSVASNWASRTPAQLKTTLALTKSDVGLANVDNTTDAGKPVSTAQAIADALKADKTTTISTTAPLRGGGDLSSNRTLSVDAFGSAQSGVVPSSGGGSTNFLRADGSWAQPPGAGGVGANVSFTFNSAITEPPIGNQLRLNNASQTVATKIWVAVMTTDGLDVTIGLAKIKAGHQIYFQDRDDASKWVKYTVTADGISKGSGAYYEFSVIYLAGSANVPFQTIQFQPVAPGAVGVPAGGTSGQAMVKLSNSDYVVGWANKVDGLNGAMGLWVGTQAQYDAIGTYTSTVVYMVTA